MGLRQGVMRSSWFLNHESVAQIWDHFSAHAEAQLQARLGSDVYEKGEWRIFLSSDNEQIMSFAKAQFKDKTYIWKGSASYKAGKT